MYFQEPEYFSLQDLRDEDIVQTSSLFALGDKVLKKIISELPLKERILYVRKVCRKFNDTVKETVKGIAFFGDQLDHCEDREILYFLSLYGKQIESINYDLFRTCASKKYTQWSWRQSVIQTMSLCPNLRHLDMLICSRHRMRDGDLQLIFKHCPKLESIKIDAQYIIGHCFTRAPTSLKIVEMELCYRFNRNFFGVMCQRLFRLKVLHVSQLNFLDDKTLRKLCELKGLEQLSIVAGPGTPCYTCSISELRKLETLKVLCLEGINGVTDRVIADFCDPAKSNLTKTLECVSFAYCRNIGSSGIEKLARLPKLRSVNLDGLSKRDVSLGIEALSRAPTLERIFLSDHTLVTPECMFKVVSTATNLRTIDISGNKFLTETSFGLQLVGCRLLLDKYKEAKKLVVLTDTEHTWMSGTHDERVIEVVHLNRGFLPPILPRNCGLSQNGPGQLPFGYLCPQIRRGNRYKMIEKEMEVVMPTAAEDQENNEYAQMLVEFSRKLDEQYNLAVASNFDPVVMQVLGIADPMYWSDFDSMATKMPQLDLQPTMSSMSSSTDSFGFSPPLNMIPQATPFDPSQPSTSTGHTNPLSSKDSFLNTITVGSGGAPCPPSRNESGKNAVVVNRAPTRYTRANRPHRKQKKESKTPPSAEPSFTEDDFPPLG